MGAVRDDPGGRLALASETYRGPTGEAPHHLPFRRAAMSFMRWEAGGAQPARDWSAGELELPELAGLVVDGTPAYAWSPAERQEWEPPPPSFIARAMKAATAPR